MPSRSLQYQKEWLEEVPGTEKKGRNLRIPEIGYFDVGISVCR